MVNILEAKEVIKSFDGVEKSIFRDLSFKFFQGSSYAITGISGAGKSTLLSLLAGIEEPSRGGVFLNDKNVKNLVEEDRKKFFHDYIGIVFQFPYLIKELTVIENVMIKGIIAGKIFEDCYDYAYELLEAVALVEKAHDLPLSLSVGQQQRISLCRALFSKPAFLLLDEPTANLDKGSADIVYDLFVDYQKQLGTGLIISCHDPFLADRMDEILVIENEKLRVQR